MTTTIRLARPGDAAELPAVERSAAQRFRTLPRFAAWADADVLAAEIHARHIAAGTVWVAETAQGDLVGFVTAERIGGELHLWELDVRRDHQGHGVGRALIDAATAHARRCGLACVTLTTFRDVPWNAPFYAALGFALLEGAAVGPRLSAVLDHEAAHGADRSERCAMRLPL